MSLWEALIQQHTWPTVGPWHQPTACTTHAQQRKGGPLTRDTESDTANRRPQARIGVAIPSLYTSPKVHDTHSNVWAAWRSASLPYRVTRWAFDELLIQIYINQMNLGVANRPGAARQGRGAGLGFCADLPFRLAGVVPKSIQSSGAHADILNTTTRPLCTSPDRRKAPGGCHLAKKRTLPPLRSLSDSNSGKSSSSSDDRRFGSSSYGGGTEGSSSTFPASGSLPSRLEDTDPTSLEAACRTVDSIWRLVAEGRQEELLQFIPDEVIDAVAELRQQQLQLRGWVT